MADAAVCSVTPRMKTAFAAMRPHRRPILSAAGAAKSAPKKVPAERMETIKDFWPAVMSGSPVMGLM